MCLATSRFVSPWCATTCGRNVGRTSQTKGSPKSRPVAPSAFFSPLFFPSASASTCQSSAHGIVFLTLACMVVTTLPCAAKGSGVTRTSSTKSLVGPQASKCRQGLESYEEEGGACHTESRPDDRLSEPCRIRKSHTNVPITQPTASERPPLHPVVLDAHAGGWADPARNLVTWISRRLSTTSLRTPGDVNLEVSQHSIATPRVPFCDVFDWFPLETPSLPRSWRLVARLE